MSEGELLQMEKARKLDITEAVYFDIIRMKTASLIASACAIGASSTTNNAETVEKMRQLGEYIGIAFQMKDDLFDYGEKEIGKPRGIDIQERKMTLPLIYTLQNADKNERKMIINVLKKHNENKHKVNALIDFIKQKGGIEYTIKRMNEFKDKALALLHQFTETDSRNSLERLLMYTIERQFLI